MSEYTKRLVASLPSTVDPNKVVVIVDFQKTSSDGEHDTSTQIIWRTMHFFDVDSVSSDVEALRLSDDDHQSIVPISLSTSTEEHTSVVVDADRIAKTVISTMLFGIVYQAEYLAVDVSKLEVCLAGLGGGALCAVLRRLVPTLPTPITAVELDGAVVELARKWFQLPPHEVDCVTCDAAEYFRAQGGTQQFGCIMLDMFGEQKPLYSIDDGDGYCTYARSTIPDVLLSEDLYRDIRAALVPSTGVLVVNFVVTSPDTARAWMAAVAGVFGRENMIMWPLTPTKLVVVACRREPDDPARPRMASMDEFKVKCDDFESKHFPGVGVELSKWL